MSLFHFLSNCNPNWVGKWLQSLTGARFECSILIPNSSMKSFGFIQDIQGLRKMCHLPSLSKILFKNDCQGKKKKQVKNESKRRKGIKLRNNNLAIHNMIESKWFFPNGDLTLVQLLKRILYEIRSSVKLLTTRLKSIFCLSSTERLATGKGRCEKLLSYGNGNGQAKWMAFIACL